MSKYVIYIETLDQKTWNINRDLKPAGYVIASGESAAQEEARKKFNLKVSQQAHVLLDTATVNRMIEEEKRQARSLNKEGKPYGQLPR